MHTKQKSDLMRDAHGLYMSGHYTQEEIANRVGITRRTLYNWMQEGNWQRARQTSIVAPTIITENFISAIIELQTAISQRPVGLRYPTPQETNTLSKLLACITRMSAFPTEALQQAALNQQNLADPANLNPQANASAFAPYNNNREMGNSTIQLSHNQSNSPASQVENNEQNEQENNYVNFDDDDLEDEPLEAMDLSPEDRKSEITKWLISQNLVPVGNLKIRTPDGSTIRVLNEIELEFIHSFGYTNDDINNALEFNLRA
jgi:DNA-binding XRE family transcriptional regulator